ncbi:DNA polymerase III subunit gamma/tau [Helicobacter saguini]|uniref:DNA-directed DNA polymerase n=1 Tax=Helicobacter saguini TaxID=1548018 RepID=A0A347VIJ6_9HELI|nr:DNA polymerase III subunit gamma/tau [Helicobacter saguini]MWV62726.1 DNA polymerase III subunit gamma/tau [Helicobacter saguini]MWV66603.1 DNA polymerase III subunit gamma/tau [Helicobacter saguini]MWV71493.1 DNA polymerase III subunit gamma/tau [Helicobacter saguini]TLD92196.1 DNA polymerase III subunit gamma/tau [Helicobacter saguini]
MPNLDSNFDTSNDTSFGASSFDDSPFDDSPPWDVNFISPNPLDAKMPYKRPNSIFDMMKPTNNKTKGTKKLGNVESNSSYLQTSQDSNKLQNLDSKNMESNTQNSQLRDSYQSIPTQPPFFKTEMNLSTANFANEQENIESKNLEKGNEIDSIKINEKGRVEQSSTINGNVRSTQPCEPAQLAVLKAESTSAEVRTSAFSKELEERGSPPFSKKAAAFCAKGERGGGFALFAQSANEHQTNDTQNHITNDNIDSKEKLQNIESRFNENNEYPNLDSKKVTESIIQDSKNLQNLDSNNVETPTPQPPSAREGGYPYQDFKPNKDSMNTQDLANLDSKENTESKAAYSPSLAEGDGGWVKNHDSQENVTLNINANKNLDSIESKNAHFTESQNIESNSQDSIKNNEITESKKTNNSQALALKYRPKTFSELIGQDSVAKTLSLALDSEKIANAYLFSGLRGSGKTSSARIFARCLECEKKITSQPCGTCTNCKEALKGTHIDIIELDGASNRGIDAIRDLIEQTKYRPVLGRFKVFIIDEVHMLTKEAFNSLLKTLEEPPPFVKFILATTDPLKLPPTILSRTQHYRFKQIPTTILKAHLESIIKIEGVSADNDVLNLLIRNGSGSVRDTLTLLDQAIVYCSGVLTSQKVATMLGSLDLSAFDSLFNALLRRDMSACVAFVREISSYEIEMILDTLSVYIREKMLLEIPQIPPILGMRYGNIIADSKAMLHLDCDGEFCLLLCVLKMFEAQKLTDITTAISQMESSVDFKALQDSNKAMESKLQDSMKIDSNKATQNIESNLDSKANNENAQSANENQKNDMKNTDFGKIDSMESKDVVLQNNDLQKLDSIESKNVDSNNLDISQTPNTTNNLDSIKNNENIESNITQDSIKESTKPTKPKYPKNITEIFPQNLDSNFQTLIAKIYDRDFKIGELFEKKVRFNGINGNDLHVTFFMDESELDLLRKGYKGLLALIREVFGEKTALKVDSKESPQALDTLFKTPITPPDSNNTESNPTQPQNIESNQTQSQKDSTQPQNTESNIESVTQDNASKAKEFVTQNKEMLQNMKENLGIKEIKVISLEDL